MPTHAPDPRLMCAWGHSIGMNSRSAENWGISKKRCCKSPLGALRHQRRIVSQGRIVHVVVPMGRQMRGHGMRLDAQRDLFYTQLIRLFASAGLHEAHHLAPWQLAGTRRDFRNIRWRCLLRDFPPNAIARSCRCAQGVGAPLTGRELQGVFTSSPGVGIPVKHGSGFQGENLPWFPMFALFSGHAPVWWDERRGRKIIIPLLCKLSRYDMSELNWSIYLLQTQINDRIDKLRVHC